MDNKSNIAQKLQDLRMIMAKNGADAYLIPRTDEYLNEFMALYAERLGWLTGFTGSAGLAIVTHDKAMVMSDGRYTIQLVQEVDQGYYSLENSQMMEISDWINQNLETGMIIGYDPRLHTPDFINKLDKAGIQSKALVGNLIDDIWVDQPEMPTEAITLFPDSIAGMSAADKIVGIREGMDGDADAVLITMLDSIAWLLNIRGGDVDHIPVTLGTVIVPKQGKVQFFVEASKVGKDVRAALEDHVEFVAPDEVQKYLASYSGKQVQFDPKRSTVFYAQILNENGARIIEDDDPCVKIRACKTSTEQQAIKEAHVTDGAALAKFLHWFDKESGKGQLDELIVEEKLESFRGENDHYKEPSFSTIAGYGANGAIVHYRANTQTNKAIKGGNLLLLDSGGQYHYGTTDITRTIAVGLPTAGMVKANTLVLKGHIALASAVFDKGTTGKELDALARKFLQIEGLEYSHGTGHGVGCYLSVHEEAPSISPRGEGTYDVGMVLSNEPGYYKEGGFGIRIENLVMIQKNEAGQLYFETITLAPIDKNLIDVSLLDEAEVQWMNTYHQNVHDVIAPLVTGDVKTWLESATALL